MPGFWRYQSSENARVSQGSEYVWVIPKYTQICLITSGYVWICRNMPEHARICLNLPEWLLFYISPFPHFFYNILFTWARGYLFERFLKRKNPIFSIASGSISFVFCSSKIYICCYIYNCWGWGVGGRGGIIGGRESWYTLLVFYFFSAKTCKEVAWKLSHICKIIDIQSFSFQLYEIIIDYLLILAKETPKLCPCAILISKWF